MFTMMGQYAVPYSVHGMMYGYDGYSSYGWSMFSFVCMVLFWTIGILFLISFIRLLASASTPSNVKNVKRSFHSDGCVHDPESHIEVYKTPDEEIDDTM